ncbi:MAG: DUF4870 domain-containing protein [Candidatus Woesearchaeota archaeon]
MAKKKVSKPKGNKTKDDSDSKLFALLGVALTIVGYVIVMLARKEDKYAMYYAKQGLIIFIASVIAMVTSAAIGWIPVIGGVISWILWLIVLVLWVIGLLYSLSGEQKEIPLIGAYANKI